MTQCKQQGRGGFTRSKPVEREPEREEAERRIRSASSYPMIVVRMEAGSGFGAAGPVSLLCSLGRVLFGRVALGQGLARLGLDDGFVDRRG